MVPAGTCSGLQRLLRSVALFSDLTVYSPPDAAPWMRSISSRNTWSGGADGIPAKWRERLTMEAEITALADSLHEHAGEAQSAEPQPGGPS